MAVLSKQGLYFFLGRSDKHQGAPLSALDCRRGCSGYRKPYFMAAAVTPALAAPRVEFLPPRANREKRLAACFSRA
jgi:hypothetical protein